MTWELKFHIGTPDGIYDFDCNSGDCLLKKGERPFCKHCPMILGTVKLPIINGIKDMEGGIARLRGC